MLSAPSTVSIQEKRKRTLARAVRNGKEIDKTTATTKFASPARPSVLHFVPLLLFPAKLNRSYLRQLTFGENKITIVLSRALFLFFLHRHGFRLKGGEAGAQFRKLFAFTSRLEKWHHIPARNDFVELKCKLMRRNSSHYQFWDRPSRNPLSSEEFRIWSSLFLSVCLSGNLTGFNLQRATLQYINILCERG